MRDFVVLQLVDIEASRQLGRIVAKDTVKDAVLPRELRLPTADTAPCSRDASAPASRRYIPCASAAPALENGA